MEIRRHPPSSGVRVQSLSFQLDTPDAKPLHILEEIIWHKDQEVTRMRDRVPLLDLRKQVVVAPAPKDFLGALQRASHKPAVIAEVKKASPSKGVFQEDFDAVAIAQSYERHGATCLSVLTDERFFQGSFQNLSQVRQAVDLPLLCKDFMISPYQIYLARAQGADAILLIAAVLGDQDLKYFLKISRSLGLTALIEVHSGPELERVLALGQAQLLGINNRDLKTFHTSLDTTCDLLQTYGSALREQGITVISESGMHQTADLDRVAAAGAQGVLVGESLIRQRDPGVALTQLIGVSIPAR
ncbi:indole-3-glycerol phosphate synthase TrpC [Prochlorothrix hollandica]|uniref:indole-3-glycerol phosphate synthase TrpC n=1 Tax=Prochlorothrix hollandica TaxID=1223 RepID=UPI00333FFFC2